MAYLNYWKVWLRLNLLTKDVENDYVAEVATEKNTLRNEDIARRIVEEGSEIKYDTLLSVMNQRDRIVRDAVRQGYSVLTEVCQITPRVSGSWLGANAKFDPSVHKVKVDMSPSSQLRETLSGVGVEVLGVKDGTAYIGLVTDTLTGLTDGSITAGEDVLISGERIKVVGDDESVGVYFVNASGVAVKVDRRLTRNEPKTVIARVPAALAGGSYTLRIATQYSNSAVSLKAPRMIEYPVFVGSSTPDSGGGESGGGDPDGGGGGDNNPL